ncbi:MAG: hypothetical protein RLZZ142_253 [Verrucomicrobiota bacterium]|jgi:hypothetical protein
MMHLLLFTLLPGTFGIGFFALALALARSLRRDGGKVVRKVALPWGALYGALWSLAPGFFSELLHTPGEAATVVLAGSLSGATVASLLVPVLEGGGPWRLGFALLALPIGAGTFGFLISWLHWGIMRATGTHYRFVMQVVEAPGYRFGPCEAARDYAVFSFLPPLILAFLPLMVLTVWHLRRLIFRHLAKLPV